MNTTQTLTVSRDLADVIDLTEYAPATQAALVAWRLTAAPAAPRTPALPHTSARRVLPTVTAEPSYAAAVTAVASVLGVGAMLVHALGTVGGV